MPSKPPSAPLNVGVASPFELVLTGLSAMLRRHPARVTLCGAPGQDGQLSGLDVVLYDTAALDPTGGADGGADLDHLVRANARVVALARPQEPALTATALERGAAGVVPMDASATQVINVLERVARAAPGGTRSTRHVDARMLLLPHDLTVREFEVLALVAAGLSNAEIAERLYVSVNTVKTYVRAAYRKIGVDRRSQAVIWCTHHGIAAN
ncbi:winged helix-turn-helix transcriptional regulator [Nocardioides sp. zg-579]|uniref:Winged helix-turn-helix transcriptional regulator n=1 Tax=Nocardioides marmotae TaxID=2663857 RepID=A0A6I3JG69_9ACTN|nr:response regulator transcription factor [Nocardioides marmotae]MCR6033378.1 winged helix-turn-helix transcriptional regulator [Gordonia jinghuaiqii]MTB97035.1 winged helix-turn-helix transcriptional regulator [Nocardioides marmotae]QKE00698.1 response regulator transcription factor [Nocardioides marmotae]